jgi:CheY-like chemotaxis protein
MTRSDLAHELRMPITAILGYTNLLVEGFAGPPEHLEKLLVIRNHSEYLLRLVNHLLTRENDSLPSRVAPVDCAAVAADVVTLMRPVARAKHLTLACEPRGALPHAVPCDEMRLRQVLINLIGNALKFTNEGSVRVTLEFAREPAQALRIAVADTGIGMSPEQVAKLFQPFVQVHLSSRARGGSGLGLSTSLRLVRQLGAELTVASQPGQGSTFTLSLPAPQVRESDLAPRQAPSRPRGAGPLAGLEVLLAAAAPDDRLLVSSLLKRHGATVTLAETPDQAFDKAVASQAAKRRFQALLLDAPVPGAELAARLRRGGYDGTIIGLARSGDDAARAHCLEAGMDDILAKPLDLDRLLAAVGDAEATRPAKRS